MTTTPGNGPAPRLFQTVEEAVQAAKKQQAELSRARDNSSAESQEGDGS